MSTTDKRTSRQTGKQTDSLGRLNKQAQVLRQVMTDKHRQTSKQTDTQTQIDRQTGRLRQPAKYS